MLGQTRRLLVSYTHKGMEAERTNTVTLRRIAPLVFSLLLIVALLLIHYTRMLDWNWTRTDESDSSSPVLPVGSVDDDEDVKDIYVTVSLESSRFVRLQELNDTFMTEHPRIQVHLTNERSERPGYADWLARSERGEAPDVMLLDNAIVLPMAVKGYLKSVDSLLVGDAMSDQLAGLLEPLRWNGYLWAVPSHIDPYLLFWNKDMLEQLGMPSQIDNFGMLEDAAKALAGGSDGAEVAGEAAAYLTNLSPGDLHQLMAWEARFHQEGTSLISLKGMDETDRSHLLWLDGYASSMISRVPLTQPIKLSELLIEDKLLSSVMTWSAYNKLNKTAKDKLVLDSEGPLYPWLNGSSYAISAGSRSDEEAILWIQEMTDAASQFAYYDASGELPVRASLYGEQAQLVFRSGLMPPIWWYEALSVKQQPEGGNVLADPEWPIRWQKREADWQVHSGEEKLEIAEFVATIPSLQP
ncbi:MAG: extracellular solute-binding protein family 1 [Paenibacillus sp.]|nr:extracellular solute-binding protein family 1 [Paenibacillus sp.]